MVKVNLRKGAAADSMDLPPPPAPGDNKPSVGSAAQTPSQKIIHANSVNDIVVDETGRKFTLRELTPLDEMQIAKAIGDNAENSTYMNWCVMAAAIASIDDELCPIPLTEREFEFMINRLGRVGVNALYLHAAKKAGYNPDEDAGLTKRQFAEKQKRRAVEEQERLKASVGK